MPLFLSGLLVVILATFAIAGDAPSEVVDRSTLTGKVMCGYQGWFNCEGDGTPLGWIHWAKNRREPFGPGNVTVDLWPDMTEYGEDERYATGFRHADGRVADVFSSGNRETVLRHFAWMQEYGIDGAFLQRFIAGHRDGALLKHHNRVLSHVREGANRSGRTFAVMYDLSGLKQGGTQIVKDDWQTLKRTLSIDGDDAYLHHAGKPVVAVWGIGFSDDRGYTLAECFDLVRWLKSQNCTVMLGVPTFWRELRRDAVSDPLLHRIIKTADIVSPWTVGRYRTPEEAKRHARDVWTADRQWCEQNDLEFLPVAFPGFSWGNLKDKQFDAIPRLNGKFLWSQFVGAKRAGCEMIYVAMFDEVDEGTAIFKCTNDVPVGDGVQFLTLKGLPSDYYLRLTGAGGKLLREELPLTEGLPNLK